jgi:hypothetical protein
VTLKHAKTSAAGASSDSSKVGGDDWNADHVIDSDGVTMVTRTDVPSSPASGKLGLFARSLAGRALPAVIGSDGLVAALQPHIGRGRSAYWIPSGNGTTLTAVGMLPPAQTGNSKNVSTTNLFQSIRRVSFSTGASSNSSYTVKPSSAQFFFGASAGMGGFHYISRFGIANSAAITDGRAFVGMVAGTGALGAINPSSAVNIIGIGYDGGDTNWSIFSNDGTGTATKTDLGANFPCTTQSVDVYELVMYVPPNSTTVKWAVTRVNTGDFASGTFTSDIPASNTLMHPQYNVVAGASAQVITIDIMSLYIETDS